MMTMWSDTLAEQIAMAVIYSREQGIRLMNKIYIRATSRLHKMSLLRFEA